MKGEKNKEEERRERMKGEKNKENGMEEENNEGSI